MRTRTLLVGPIAIAVFAGCSRTENGDVVVKRPSISVKTSDDTIHPPTITTRTDTVNTPVIGTKTETLIVKKPVVGTRKTEIQVPTTKKP